MHNADQVEGSNAPSQHPQEAFAVPDYAVSHRSATPLGILAVVAVKIMGLYCLVEALPLLYLTPMYLRFALNSGDWMSSEIWIGLAHPVSLIVIGVVLIRGATWIVMRVLGFEEPSAADLRGYNSPGRRVQGIAFSVLGVWLVADGAIEFVRVLVTAHFASRLTGNDVIENIGDNPVPVVAAGLKLALGVALFLGGKRLAYYWHRFRLRPIPPAPRDAEN